LTEACWDKVEIYRELLRKDPQNASWQFELARGLGYLGALQNQQSNSVAAVTTLDEAVSLHDALVARDSANREWEILLVAELVDERQAHDHRAKLRTLPNPAQ